MLEQASSATGSEGTCQWQRTQPECPKAIRSSLQRELLFYCLGLFYEMKGEMLEAAGQSREALPGEDLDIDLFRYRKRIIDLDPEVPDGALDFCVPKQKLNRP